MEILKTDEYRNWMKKLRDTQSKARINARLRLCEIAGKPVGDLHPVCNGISELRFTF